MATFVRSRFPASPEGRERRETSYAIDATRHCAGPDVKDSRGDDA